PISPANKAYSGSGMPNIIAIYPRHRPIMPWVEVIMVSQ
ncbi:MAG: hypothetical protein ACI83Q_000880, partial [Colwellia polaris]